jgi:hypothetical protein
MKRGAVLLAVSLFSLALLAGCLGGGGGGSSSFNYNGNTNPAVADSTQVIGFAQGVYQSTFLAGAVGQFFMNEDEGDSLSAVPQICAAGTQTVAFPIPSNAVIDGTEFGGSGTLTFSGTLYLDLICPVGTEWLIDDTNMVGQLAFDGFAFDDDGGPALDGTINVSESSLFFSNLPNFDDSIMDFVPSEMGDIIWNTASLDFDQLTISFGSDSFTMGEADWEIDRTDDPDLWLKVYSLAVDTTDGPARLEDTGIALFTGSYMPFGSPSPTPIDYVDIYLNGTDSQWGTFYHGEYGYLYFRTEGNLREEDPPNDLVDGNVLFSEDASTPIMDVEFGYDEGYGSSYYILWFDGGLVGSGHVVDGIFDDTVPAPG